MRGLNIHWPFSQLIMQGAKQKEIRSYPLGHRGIGQPNEEMWLIENPGPRRTADADALVGDLTLPARPERTQIIGSVCFSHSDEYETTAAFHDDTHSHRIKRGGGKDWDGKGKRHAWHVCAARPLMSPIATPSDKSKHISNSHTATATFATAVAGYNSPSMAPAAAPTASSVSAGLRRDLEAPRSRRYDFDVWGKAGGRRKPGRRKKDSQKSADLERQELEQTIADNRLDRERCRELLTQMDEEDLRQRLANSRWNPGHRSRGNDGCHALDDNWLAEACAAFNVSSSYRRHRPGQGFRIKSHLRQADLVAAVISAVRQAKQLITGSASERDVLRRHGRLAVWRSSGMRGARSAAAALGIKVPRQTTADAWKRVKSLVV